MTVELEDSYILLYNGKLDSFRRLTPPLEVIAQSGKPLLIIANDFEEEVVSGLVINKLRGGMQIVAVKTPNHGDKRQAILEDIAVLTGGTVISEGVEQLCLEDADLDVLGSCGKVNVTSDSTTILSGKGE